MFVKFNTNLFLKIEMVEAETGMFGDIFIDGIEEIQSIHIADDC